MPCELYAERATVAPGRLVRDRVRKLAHSSLQAVPLTALRLILLSHPLPSPPSPFSHPPHYSSAFLLHHQLLTTLAHRWKQQCTAQKASCRHGAELRDDVCCTYMRAFCIPRDVWATVRRCGHLHHARCSPTTLDSRDIATTSGAPKRSRIRLPEPRALSYGQFARNQADTTK